MLKTIYFNSVNTRYTSSCINTHNGNHLSTTAEAYIHDFVTILLGSANQPSKTMWLQPMTNIEKKM